MQTNYELFHVEKNRTEKNSSVEFKQTNAPVKTALSFHNENKAKFLISEGCKWSLSKPVRYLHGLPLKLHIAIIRLSKLVYVNES